MAEFFGLDFGTTNTLACRIAVSSDGSPEPRDYTRSNGSPHVSAIAYEGDQVLVCRDAYERLEGGEGGDIGLRSPKSLLGTGERPVLAGLPRKPTEMCAAVIGHAIRHAREQAAAEHHEGAGELAFDHGVLTIPVDLDGRGRQELREAARLTGLSIHQFVHEPLAALYAHLRGENLERKVRDLGESPVLVVDWGGGTLDLTLVQIRSGMLIQFLSQGEHRVGGDRFDETLRDLVKRRHYEEHGLTSLDHLNDGAAQRLLLACETTKINLSGRESWPLYVPNYVAVDGAAAHIDQEITRHELEHAAAPLLKLAIDRISAILGEARIEDGDLGLVLLAGGMSGMPLIRTVLRRRFGLEKVPAVTDAQRLVVHGAAWIAHDRRRLRLAKPIELELADHHPAVLLPEGMELPVDEQVFPERFPVYCTDPRSGRARFVITRPRDPGRAQLRDQRRTYGTLQLPVDANLGVLEERLDLDVVVDSNLIVTITAHSERSGRTESRQIHELEFGLGIGAASDE